MTVLVLGGYGAVGTHLVRLLRARGVTALAAGRDPARADRVVDLTSAKGIDTALSDVSVVVNCAGIEEIGIARECAARGTTFVDISATSDYVHDLESIDGPVALGIGLAPGLTTLLAADLLSSTRAPVDILITLGAGERHGHAATSWTYQLLGRHFPDPDGGSIRNFTRPTRFDLPAAAGFPQFPAVRADFADQHRLTEQFAVPVRSHLRMDTRLATTGLAALTWVPALRALAPSRMPGGDRWLVLARSADGPTRWASGSGQSAATAAVAAACLRVLPHRPITAPTWIHEFTELNALRQDLTDAGITLST